MMSCNLPSCSAAEGHYFVKKDGAWTCCKCGTKQ